VMSYATGLSRGRPVPAGILAFSGFLPTVEGWQPDLPPRRGLPVLIAHGRRDPVISVEFGRTAAARLADGGLDVDYRESDVGHTIDAGAVQAAGSWLSRTLAPPEPSA
jgi:phospholipase/carboxylesterase